MAKAIFGHMAADDPRLIAELVSLRARVRELAAENESLRAELQLAQVFAELPPAIRAITS